MGTLRDRFATALSRRFGGARPRYHELMALFGVGDLHPGGSPTTDFLLDELAKENPSTVLEVGAGAGRTTERMLKRGWRVTAIEPSAVLCERLEARCGIAPQQMSFEGFDGNGTRYDAVIGEGAFYRLDTKSSLSKVRGLLRPGGLLAFSDMVWTEAAKPDVVDFIHTQTLEAFGIPMASRDVLTWPVWTAALREAGFSEVVSRRLDPAAFDPAHRSRRARIALGLLTHPGLVPLYLRYRSYSRIAWAPPGWLESWLSVWRLGGA